MLWTILASLQSLPLAVSISQTSWIMDLWYLICIKFLEIPLAMTLLDLKKFWAFCTTAVYDLGAFDVYLCFWTPFAPSSIQGIQGVTALEQILIVVHQSMSLIVLTLMLHKFLLKTGEYKTNKKHLLTIILLSYFSWNVHVFVIQWCIWALNDFHISLHGFFPCISSLNFLIFP
jgi:hypothetical protein